MRQKCPYHLWLAASFIGLYRPSNAVTWQAHESLSPPSCPSRTVNYITHTLPQQCLRTDWAGNRTSLTSSQDSLTPTAAFVLIGSVPTAQAADKNSSISTGTKSDATTSSVTESTIPVQSKQSESS